MWNLIAGALLYVAGLIFGAYIINDGPRIVKTLGTTYSELSSMKEECEHSLPRNQHCIASTIFLPTASEE